MKKKILLMAFATVLFVLALALCVGAATIYRDSEGDELFRFETDENSIITTYQGEFPKTDSEGDALTWYVTATATEGENTVKTVVSFKTLDEKYATLDANGIYSYKNGTGATTKTVVAVNFPYDMGIKKLNLANGGYKNNIHYDPNGTEILFVYLPNTMTELPERIVQGSKALVCHIPMEAQIPKISHVAFYEAKCLREVNIPATVTEIAGQGSQNGSAFYCCDSLEIVHIGENSQLETIGVYAFHRNYKLREFKIPDSVTFVGSHAFSYTALVESPFGVGSRCEEIGGRAFSDNTALKTFIVPATLKKVDILGNNTHGPLSDCPNIELVTFGNSAPITQLFPSFFGRAGIEKVVLPEGPTNIPNRLFIEATVLDVTFPSTVETASEYVFVNATVGTIRLGANFKYFINSAQNHQSFTNGTKGLEAIYIPASFYAESPETVYQVSHAFEFGACSNVKVFYTGTDAQWAIAMENFKAGTKEWGTNNGKVTGATLVSYEEYMKDTEKYASGSYLIWGYDPCQAFCEPFVEEGTVREGTIAYENGYLEKGVKSTACPICGTLAKGTAVDPIFICYGYSVPENGQGGIVIFYTIDKIALGEYTSITGKSITYGVFAASYEKLGENDAVNKNGVLADGVVGTEIKNKDNAGFEIKVVGFTTDAQKSAKLVVSAYAITTKDDEAEVSYLQAEAPTEGSRYNIITFNDFNTSK